MNNINSVGSPIVKETKLSLDDTGEAVNATYFKKIIGSLMYLTATGLDLMLAVSLLSRYIHGETCGNSSNGT